MPGVQWLTPLGCVLLVGCASQPYPPLPASASTQIQADVSAVPGPSPSTADTGGQAEPVDGLETGGDASSLPPPVSQEVNPPPPDPDALPEAEKRQLDIRIASQRFNYFEDDQLVWTGPISTGTREHPTPKGRYQVQRKDIDKRSGSYTNYFERPTPMPYALQFLGPYWVHEGYVTGKPESHGCVRLRHADAKFVYERIRVGDRIVVAD